MEVLVSVLVLAGEGGLDGVVVVVEEGRFYRP